MVSQQRPCPVRGCTGHAQPKHVMCLEHWKRVSRSTQEAVYETWRAVGARPTLDAIQAHRGNVKQAIMEAGAQ